MRQTVVDPFAAERDQIGANSFPHPSSRTVMVELACNRPRGPECGRSVDARIHQRAVLPTATGTSPEEFQVNAEYPYQLLAVRITNSTPGTATLRPWKRKQSRGLPKPRVVLGLAPEEAIFVSPQLNDAKASRDAIRRPCRCRI